MCTINSNVHSSKNAMSQCDRSFVEVINNSINCYIIELLFDHSMVRLHLVHYDDDDECSNWSVVFELKRDTVVSCGESSDVGSSLLFFAVYNDDRRIYFAYVAFHYLIYWHLFSIDICFVTSHNSRSTHRARCNSRWSIVYLLQWQ
jgi:hypothetical protein